MSDPFYKFLSSGGGYKSYAHATGLYLTERLARAPKFGFIYYVSFTINPSTVKDKQWTERYYKDIGMLVKKVDLPKFKITTETLNQYNRKTNIQTKISYEPITFEFHDDNSEITNGLWKNYYKYYYADSGYTSQGNFGGEFSDNKYSIDTAEYGLNNHENVPFFDKIDIFVLHQGKFTQISIANPLITSWDHDVLNQGEATKTMQNKMSVAYDNVAYYQGEIVSDDTANAYKALYYDNIPGSIGQGNQNNAPTIGTVFGPKPAPAPEPVPSYPSPTATGASLSQLAKIAAKAAPSYPAPMQSMSSVPRSNPYYPVPRPIGAGTFGLSSYRPPSLLGGISLWFGKGGLHGTGVINAGPIRLVLKK
jgi:hypothetical protein